MKKKFFNWSVILAVLVGMVLMYNINAIAYTKEDTPGAFATDKSDRSLIKEVLVNQKQILSLLNDIKGSCKSR